MGKKSKNKNEINKKKNDGNSGRTADRDYVNNSSTSRNVGPGAGAPSRDDKCQTLKHEMITAQAFVEREEYRKAAEHYLNAYRNVDNSNLFHPTSKFMYTIFVEFSHMLGKANFQDGFKDKQNDIKVLEKFADSEVEPSLVRVVAARVASAFLSCDSQQLAAEMLRLSISLCDSVSDVEKYRIVIYGGSEMKQVGWILKRLKEETAATLAKMTEPNPDNLSYSKQVSAGGESCDACGKTREELGVIHMKCCKRCGMVYYCSEECQSKQWKAGHKKACRKPGQIEEGDAMLVDGEATESRHNRVLAKVIGPVDHNQIRKFRGFDVESFLTSLSYRELTGYDDPVFTFINGDRGITNNDSTGYWKVQLKHNDGSDGPTRYVSTDKLHHIRPAA